MPHQKLGEIRIFFKDMNILLNIILNILNIILNIINNSPITLGLNNNFYIAWEVK